MHRILIGLVALVLAACGSSAGTATADPSPSVEATSDQSQSQEPAPTVEPSATALEDVETTIVGSIGFDDIEGGCAYVQANDGTTYEVNWPDGWSLDSELNLIDPSGEVVAGVGDEVTLGGRIANDMASICQIGPIFEAVEVEIGG